MVTGRFLSKPAFLAEVQTSRGAHFPSHPPAQGLEVFHELRGEGLCFPPRYQETKLVEGFLAQKGRFPKLLQDFLPFPTVPPFTCISTLHGALLDGQYEFPMFPKPIHLDMYDYDRLCTCSLQSGELLAVYIKF